MKRLSLLLPLVAILVLVIGVWPSSADVVGSRHDFSDDAWFTTDPDHSASYQQNNVCRVCHKPHHGQNAQEGLLWNRALSSASYTMYDSSWSESIDGAVDPEPTGVSRLCLSCHDGTVALESWDGVESPTNTTLIGTIGGEIGTELTHTHPISIVYDDSPGLGLNPTSTTFSTGPSIAEVLRDGKLQCNGCHDVHAENVTSSFVLTRDSGHALCLTCHDK